MLDDPELVPPLYGLLCPYPSRTHHQPLVPCSLAPNTSWPETFPGPVGHGGPQSRPWDMLAGLGSGDLGPTVDISELRQDAATLGASLSSSVGWEPSCLLGLL